ncbi:MAG TPA: cell division protein SepF [Nitrososphaeraceae archaeon]|nr:cell division protein SepF [Nitrososphaeraceae archaeon]
MTFDQHDYLTILLGFTYSLIVKMNSMQAQKSPLYLKAISIRDIKDISSIKDEIKKDIILILRVTPLAQKDVEELRKIIEELYTYVRSTGGDIARLGEERVVVTPPSVKIWRRSYDLK